VAVLNDVVFPVEAQPVPFSRLPFFFFPVFAFSFFLHFLYHPLCISYGIIRAKVGNSVILKNNTCQLSFVQFNSHIIIIFFLEPPHLHSLSLRGQQN